MLKINGIITKINDRPTSKGTVRDCYITDAGFTYKITDFSGVFNMNNVGDTIHGVNVRAKAFIYNDKAYVSYTC